MARLSDATPKCAASMHRLDDMMFPTPDYNTPTYGIGVRRTPKKEKKKKKKEVFHYSYLPSRYIIFQEKKKDYPIPR